ncbi:MAG: hypothetical protein ACH346_07910 [Chthoniobacterales bacterium]
MLTNTILLLRMKKVTKSNILSQVLLASIAILLFSSFSQAALVLEEAPPSFTTIVKGSNYPKNMNENKKFDAI